METTYDSAQISFPLGVSHTDLPLARPKSITEDENIPENARNLIGIFEDDFLVNDGKIFNQLRKYAMQRTRDYHLAEDVVVDFYCNIIRKIKDGKIIYKYLVDRERGIRGNPRIIPWAYACVSNSCIDFNRRRYSGINRKISDRHDLSKEFGIDSIDDPQEAASKRELKNIIRQGMLVLDEPHRQVIQLCYLEGYRYREAAEMLKIPLGTVKSRMHNALINLREILSHYDYN